MLARLKMKQITIRQLVRQGNEANLRAWMPCEITVDGIAIAALIPIHDVRQANKANHDVRQANELKFSKARQAAGKMR